MIAEVIARVKRMKMCRHAHGTRHCGNPRCSNYIGKVRT